ncbi:adenylosuccinate lyase, partial [Candidatus Peregrinibacteria bacterium]|nr:adenylosuccinate lyase [Candidatus Peregrinibacteria bacterium]
MLNQLNAISAVDGRYRNKVETLSRYFSEAALMRYRVRVEVEWFIFLCNTLRLSGAKVLNLKEQKLLRDLYNTFSEKDAERIKQIESTTNHDVKAVEYFIKEKLARTNLAAYSEFVHFGCTSEDINNLAYGLIIHEFGNEEFLPVYKSLIKKIHEMAKQYAGIS